MNKPWESEPNEFRFEHKGFKCLLLRGPLGQWCGYVGLPITHPCYQKKYQDLDLDIHGGLTYSGFRDNNSLWYLGFDCAHYMDIVPEMTYHYPSHDATYKDINYVIEEVKKLASQLI